MMPVDLGFFAMHHLAAWFTETQKTFLNHNTEAVATRAKALHEFQNPSTSIYKLIEMLKGDARPSTESI